MRPTPANAMKTLILIVVVVVLLVKQSYAKGLVDYGDGDSDRNAFQRQRGFNKYQYGDTKYGKQYDEMYDNVQNYAFNPAFEQAEQGSMPNRLKTLNDPFSLRSLSKETQQHKEPNPRQHPGSRTSLNRLLSQASQIIRNRNPSNPGVEWGPKLHTDDVAVPFDTDRIQSNTDTNEAFVEKVKTNLTASQTQYSSQIQSLRGKRHDKDVVEESDGERQERPLDIHVAIDTKMEAINKLNRTIDNDELHKAVSSPPEVENKITGGWSDHKDTFQDNPEGAEKVNNSNNERRSNMYELNLDLVDNSNASFHSNYTDGKKNAEAEPDTTGFGDDGSPSYDHAANTYRREEEELEKYVLSTVSHDNNQNLDVHGEYSVDKLEKLIADLSKFRQLLLHTVLFSIKKSSFNGSIENILRPMLNYIIGTVIRNLLFILAADAGSMVSNQRFYENANHHDYLRGIQATQVPIESPAKVQVSDQNMNYPHSNKLNQFVDRSYGYSPQMVFENSPYQHQPSQESNPNMGPTSYKSDTYEPNSEWISTASDDDGQNVPKNQIFGNSRNRVEGGMLERNQINDNHDSRGAIPYLDNSNQNRLSQIDPLTLSLEENRGYPNRSNRRLKVEGNNLV